MSMMNLLNHTHRGVVLHWGNAQTVADRPDLTWVPYLGGFVVVAPGQVLPPEADVLARQADYEAQMMTKRARGAREAALAVHDAAGLPRPSEDAWTVMLTKGLIARADIPTPILDRINAKRALRGEPPL